MCIEFHCQRPARSLLWRGRKCQNISHSILKLFKKGEEGEEERKENETDNEKKERSPGTISKLTESYNLTIILLFAVPFWNNKPLIMSCYRIRKRFLKIFSVQKNILRFFWLAGSLLASIELKRCPHNSLAWWLKITSNTCHDFYLKEIKTWLCNNSQWNSH